MEREIYENYVAILRGELVPALGCTEPIAIAYASALARKVLGREATIFSTSELVTMSII